MMLRVALQMAIEPPWTDLPPLQVGEFASIVGTPTIYALIEDDGTPLQRIDIYVSSSECLAFQEAVVWRNFIVIGFGGHVYLLARDSQEAHIFPQEGYFGHLYPTEGRLFVASAERLVCIDIEGTLIWRTEPLGLDGVIVDEIRDGVLWGHGEWDPPGGWRPFLVDVKTGICLPRKEIER